MVRSSSHWVWSLPVGYPMAQPMAKVGAEGSQNVIIGFKAPCFAATVQQALAAGNTTAAVEEPGNPHWHAPRPPPSLLQRYLLICCVRIGRLAVDGGTDTTSAAMRGALYPRFVASKTAAAPASEAGTFARCRFNPARAPVLASVTRRRRSSGDIATRT